MSKMNYINKTYDEERALYGIKDSLVLGCTFRGEADGESALKETQNITVRNCSFSLRYPLWHVTGFTIENSKMDEGVRAPLWYSVKGVITDTKIEGVKCLRECEGIKIQNSDIRSAEFGWRCKNLKILDSSIVSEYLFFGSSDIEINNLTMSGKYSFQYTENVTVQNSVLNTKDAFWHAKNVTVKDSVVSGEYLAWYSENLTFINCKISGTQPLCYCKNLKLINCTMENTDLSFERSEVDADINGEIMSVKNPISGTVIADSIGDVIIDIPNVNAQIKIRSRL